MTSPRSGRKVGCPGRIAITKPQGVIEFGADAAPEEFLKELAGLGRIALVKKFGGRIVPDSLVAAVAKRGRLGL
jgi:hypothetical protein